MSDHYKYPRTLHLPWSRRTSDDKKLDDDSQFHGKQVVVSLKMDGENTTMYDDKIHARSLDSNNHFTRNWVKGEWGRIAHELEGLRVCGENLWAQHTITYENLESFFYAFSVWDNDSNWCHGWDTTVAYTDMLELKRVPVIYEGIYDAELIKNIFEDYAENHEGYVVRTRHGFHYNDFSEHVAKYVKPKFQEDLERSTTHWLYDKIQPNKLKEE